MTIEECYQELGGNYGEVSTRLSGPAMIQRFAARFPDDPSFAALSRELEAGNRREAFRAAHTLKGVCANLSFSRLQASAAALTEVLRRESDTVPAEAVLLMETVREDYQTTVAAIRRFLREQ